MLTFQHRGRTTFTAMRVRYRTHREWHSLLAVVFGLLIQASAVALSALEFKRLNITRDDATVHRVFEAGIQSPFGQFAVIHRKVMFGYLLCAIPEERVTSRPPLLGIGRECDESYVICIDQLQLDGRYEEDDGASMYSASVSPKVRNGVLSEQQASILRGYLEPDSQYTEVLIVGFPLPCLSAGLETALRDISMGTDARFLTPRITLIRTGYAATRQSPRLLLGAIPTRPHVIPLVADLAILGCAWIGITHAVLWCSCWLRERRGMCPLCKHGLSASGACFECGFPNIDCKPSDLGNPNREM